MDGYLLLADGMRLGGELRGAPHGAYGWLTANTSVVGFQEMATDPAYSGCVLAFTYPEIGNVGVAERFSESCGVQTAALVVKVLSDVQSHYLSEGSLEGMLRAHGVPCLAGVDTRGLAVHMREEGEMPAAVLPDGAELDAALAKLRNMERPEFRPPDPPQAPESQDGPLVAVLDLGVRRSHLRQIATVARPTIFPWDADAEEILAGKPAGLFVSDGPGTVPPPKEAVRTLKGLVGRVPMLGCGLGCVALGMAYSCAATQLPRGHHGANYPVRNRLDGSAAVTQQRHTVALDRCSVESCERVELVWENMNDGSVEGVRSADASAVGLQHTLPAPQRGVVNPHIARFVEWIAAK